MSAHTPGPWCRWWIYSAIRHINRNVDDGEMFLRAEDKKLVDEGKLHTPNVRTHEGDVDLITAAPDLLAACEAMDKMAVFVFGEDTCGLPAQWREELVAMRAAIAKARGK